MKKIIFLTCFLIVTIRASAQTPKQVNAFPEDYIGKTITFANTAFWPRLNNLSGYYEVLINVSDDLADDEWGFGSLDKIYGAVSKPLAKEMLNGGVGGANTKYYYGSVTGRVVKTSKVFGSDYIFLITKIINYPIGEPDSVVHVFKQVRK